MMVPDVTAAILAGGTAKRMGGIIKPAVVVGGQTILSRMLSVLNDVFTEIIIVSNSPEQFYSQYNLPVVPDIIKGKGPLGGIHSALLNSVGQAVFVFAGDMPLIDKSLILSQIVRYKKLDSDIVVPRSGEFIEPLHAIYSKNVSGTLEKFLLEGNGNAVRDFLNIAGAAFFEPGGQTGFKKAFLNINSPADIVIAEEILKDGFSYF